MLARAWKLSSAVAQLRLLISKLPWFMCLAEALLLLLAPHAGLASLPEPPPQPLRTHLVLQTCVIVVSLHAKGISFGVIPTALRVVFMLPACTEVYSVRHSSSKCWG